MGSNIIKLLLRKFRWCKLRLMNDKKVMRFRGNKNLEIKNSVYKMLGVDDVEAFYADKFVWQPEPNIIDNAPLSKFNIAYLKQYWIYDRIKEGARVLDVGCGSGTLNLLKSKNITLVGADISEKGLEMALGAGYDEAVLCDIYDLPFPSGTFDYIVSLDVLGHIENEVKDAYLEEWIRLLKDDGVMLHGIEEMNIDYTNLDDKTKEYVLIDGHVGLESSDRIEERFKRYFNEVNIEGCMGSCLNWFDIEKYEMTGELVGQDFRKYLLTFDHPKIEAFNAAMLLVRNLLAKDKILGLGGGFVFVEANTKKIN